jgi:hypothetical protein
MARHSVETLVIQVVLVCICPVSGAEELRVCPVNPVHIPCLSCLKAWLGHSLTHCCCLVCGCRFARRIYVPLPERSARAHLLAECLRDVEVSISPAEFLQLADKCAKYSGRDLVMLCREASMRPLRELWGGKLLSCNASKTADIKASESMGDDEKRSRVVSMLVKHMEVWMPFLLRQQRRHVPLRRVARASLQHRKQRMLQANSQLVAPQLVCHHSNRMHRNTTPQVL